MKKLLISFLLLTACSFASAEKYTIVSSKCYFGMQYLVSQPKYAGEHPAILTQVRDTGNYPMECQKHLKKGKKFKEVTDEKTK